MNNPAMEELRVTLSTRGWTDVIEPSLRDHLIMLVDQLSAPIRQKDAEPDDILRGKIAMLRLMLGQFRAKLSEYDAEKNRSKAVEIEPKPIGSPYAPEAQVNPED
jgi:hypothetical protein